MADPEERKEGWVNEWKRGRQAGREQRAGEENNRKKRFQGGFCLMQQT